MVKIHENCVSKSWFHSESAAVPKIMQEKDKFRQRVTHAQLMKAKVQAKIPGRKKERSRIEESASMLNQSIS
jgi:hypothetical protein